MAKHPAIPIMVDMSILLFLVLKIAYTPAVFHDPVNNIFGLFQDYHMLPRQHQKGGVGVNLDGFYLMGIDEIFLPIKPGYLNHGSNYLLRLRSS
jgi:hypothetical protein